MLAPRLIALLWLLAPLAVLAAEVTGQLDRDRIVEGETVTLLLETGDPQQSLETDLGALAEDFRVIDQRTETQMSIVGGRQLARVRRLLTLEPKGTGALTVPSLAFAGGSRTDPMTLTVEPAPEPAPGELPPVFIEVEVDPQEGPYYVHAQLSLKVRIFYQQNLTEAAIKPPEPDQASVRLLDELPYQADRNGEQYRVLERRYAVFPERSGTLTIPSMQLTGRLIEKPADRLWQPAVRGRRVRIESDPVVLDVNPRPADFSGAQWLPARSVRLEQQITDGGSVKVGEPVTRTVILDAVGLEENMLEEPRWPEISNARVYPDQPQGISRDDGQWVLGHREYRYAVVPEQPGELVLPEIRLAWWDTVNHRERVAVLPEQRVTVLPAGLGSPAFPPSSTGAGVSTASAAGSAADARLWQWLSLALGLLWLATVFLWLRGRASPGAAQGQGASTKDGERETRLLGVLGGACKRDDARAAHGALGRWLRHFGPPGAAGSVMHLARACDDEGLGQAIRALDARIYREGAGDDWDGRAFWQAFEGWRRAGARTGTADERPAGEGNLDLYAAVR